MDEKTQVLTKDDVLKSFDQAFGQKIDSKLATLDDVIATYKPAVAVKAEVDGKSADAKLEESGAGVIGKLTNAKLWEIPVGAIAIGTFGGVFVSELVDGFMSKQGTMAKGAIKLVGAGLVASLHNRGLGKDANYAIAFVLGVFGLSQILPIDKWAVKAAGSLKGLLPGTIKVTGMQGDVVTQAETVAGNYYGKMLGGR